MSLVAGQLEHLLTGHNCVRKLLCKKVTYKAAEAGGIVLWQENLDLQIIFLSNRVDKHPAQQVLKVLGYLPVISYVGVTS